MDVQIFEQSHLVRYYECDSSGNLSLPMLLNVLLDVSGNQCTALGVGEAFTRKLDVAWVVIQYEINMKRMPALNETILVRTIPISYNKLFSYRKFEIIDQAGEKIVEVNSSFVLMNLSERKMSPILAEVVTPFGIEKTTKITRMTRPEKLTEEVTTKTYNVRYLDIDSNRHVNNSKYLDWVIDSLDLTFLNSHALTYCNVKYDKEVEYGNQIQSHVSIVPLGDGQIKTVHVIQNSDHTSCEVTLKWQKIS